MLLVSFFSCQQFLDGNGFGDDENENRGDPPEQDDNLFAIPSPIINTNTASLKRKAIKRRIYDTAVNELDKSGKIESNQQTNDQSYFEPILDQLVFNNNSMLVYDIQQKCDSESLHDEQNTIRSKSTVREPEQIVPEGNQNFVQDIPQETGMPNRKIFKGRRKSVKVFDHETMLKEEYIAERMSNMTVECISRSPTFYKLNDQVKIKKGEILLEPFMKGSVVKQINQRRIFVTQPTDVDLSILSNILRIQNPSEQSLAKDLNFFVQNSKDILNKNISIPREREMNNEPINCNDDIINNNYLSRACPPINVESVELPEIEERAGVDRFTPPCEFQDFCIGTMASSTPSFVPEIDPNIFEKFKSKCINYSDESMVSIVFKKLIELWNQNVYPVNLTKLLSKKSSKLEAGKTFYALLSKIFISIEVII